MHPVYEVRQPMIVLSPWITFSVSPPNRHRLFSCIHLSFRFVVNVRRFSWFCLDGQDLWRAAVRCGYPSAEGAACFQQAICSRISNASSSRVWQHFLPSLQSYLGSFSSFTVNISHQAPFEVSATRYAIKGVLHLYLMSLPAKGISLRRQCGGGGKERGTGEGGGGRD